MPSERIPFHQPDEPERKRFEAGGRKFSLTPEEEKAHQEAERRRLANERNADNMAEEEIGGGEASNEIRKRILEELVPNEKTRAGLSQDVVDLLVNAKLEELRKEEEKTRRKNIRRVA